MPIILFHICEVWSVVLFQVQVRFLGKQSLRLEICRIKMCEAKLREQLLGKEENEME